MDGTPNKKLPWHDDNPLARVDAINPDTGKPYERAEQNRALRYSFVTGLSLSDLCAVFNQEPGVNLDYVAMWQSDTAKPPVTRLRTLESWSADLDWQARVARQSDLDAAIDEAKRKQRRAEAIAYIEDKGIEHGRFVVDAIDSLILKGIKPGEIVGIVSRDEDGNPKVEQVELFSVEAYLDLMKLRMEGDTLLRRAVGLPDKYTQTRLADNEGGPLEMPRITYEEAAPPNEAEDTRDGD